MNLKTWMLAALGLGAVASSDARYTKVPSQDATRATNLLNVARRRVSARQPAASHMPEMSWDNNLENALNQFLLETPPAWLWQRNDTTVKANARYNIEAMMLYEPFVSQLPGYGFLFHDGCMSISTAVSRGFSLRLISQAHCFNYASCINPDARVLPNMINDYQSCAQPFQPYSHGSCSWSWQYIPPALNDKATKFACALTGTPGPNAAGYRPNHYLCYFNTVNKKTSPYPYESGVACSECPTDTKCVKRLCV